MAVFRIERNRDYTVMSNHHLRDTELSLKSKGLLSMMLSLPEEWNYTTRGLAAICKEGADCIGSALRELEQAGYIVRNRIRDSKGKIVDVEYIIYETPHKPQSAPPEPERPDTENPDMDIPCPEMTAQLNKDREKKDGSKKDSEITDEIYPIPSYRPSQETRMGTDGMEVRERYRDILLENIDYDVLIQNPQIDQEQLNEIVEILVDTVCTSRKTIRIASDDFPADVVRSRFLKLTGSHIQYVLACMREKVIKYIRYADDFILGVKGDKADCERIKRQLSDFISQTLKMELSEQKTLITHSNQYARFLGYDIRVRRDQKLKPHGNHVSRTLNGSVELCIPFAEINTVLPYETDLLGIVPGEDLCTLVTCTPYGVNTHRLLVRGSRIPYEEVAVMEEETASTEQAASTWEVKYLQGILWGIAAALGSGVIILTGTRIYRKARKGGCRYVKK